MRSNEKAAFAQKLLIRVLRGSYAKLHEISRSQEKTHDEWEQLNHHR